MLGVPWQTFSVQLLRSRVRLRRWSLVRVQQRPCEQQKAPQGLTALRRFALCSEASSRVLSSARLELLGAGVGPVEDDVRFLQRDEPTCNHVIEGGQDLP